MFAATPPVEHIKYLLSRAAGGRRNSEPTVVIVQGIKKSYLFAPATRRVYIELPPEDYEQGKVGLLTKSLYRTWDAALDWTTAYISVLVNKIGFVQGNSTPCAVYHEKLQIRRMLLM